MQRKKLWWSVLSLILCGCLCTCPPTPSPTSVPTPTSASTPTPTELGKVELEATKVWHQHAGESQYELTGSAPLYDDDHVWTDVQGKALLKFLDIWIRVYKKGEQKAKSLASDHTEITQSNGTALYGMSSTGKVKVTIQAGHAVIEANGTIFTVSYVPDEETTLLRTIEGVARMRTQYADGSLGEWREVPANKWSTVVEESDPTLALPVSQMDGIVDQLGIRDVIEMTEEDVITQDFAPPGVSIPAPEAVVRVPATGSGPAALTLVMPEGAESDLVGTQLARFTQQTGVDVELVNIEVGSLYEQYATMAAAGMTDFDVILVDMSQAATLYDRGVIAPIGEGIADMALNIDDFFPGALQAFTYQDELLALPGRMDVPLLYYRSDVLEARGVNPPETYEELMSQASTFPAEADLAYGYIWAGVDGAGNVLAEHIAAYGGEIINSDGEVVINSHEAADGLSQMVAYMEEGASTPEVLEWSGNDLIAIFRDGRAALFMRNWSYAWSAVNEAGSPVAGVVGVASLPQSANSLWCNGFAVWGLSEHPEEAAWLAAFLAGAEQQEGRARELGYHPTRRSVYERLPEGWGAFGDQVGVLQQASEAAIPLPTVRAYNEVVGVLDNGTTLALYGEVSTEEAIGMMYDELVSIVP